MRKFVLERIHPAACARLRGGGYSPHSWIKKETTDGLKNEHE